MLFLRLLLYEKFGESIISFIPVNYLMNYVMLFQMHRTEFSDIEVC